MPIEKKSTAAKQIRQIITVLGLGALSAVLLAIATLYYFGPAGSFKVSNILLSPERAQALNYTDINPTTRKPEPFTLDRIDFLYQEGATEGWVRKQVDLPAYEEFYDLIKGDASLAVIPDNVSSLFGKGDQAVLYIMVKKTGSVDANVEKRSFQELQIQGHGDYYRIQIHDEEEGRNWAYFYHEGIYDDALKTLVSQP